MALSVKSVAGKLSCLSLGREVECSLGCFQVRHVFKDNGICMSVK